MNHLTDSQLNEYFDEALDTSARREIDSHLESCTECRARLEELQSVFSDLAELHEIKMPRDLTSSIMAHVPQKPSFRWNPFFAAQLGAVFGVLFWFSMQAAEFILPTLNKLEGLDLSKLIPTFQLIIPAFQIPNLLFTIPHLPSPLFNFSIFQLSNLQHLNLPTFQLSTFNLTFISTGIFILWLFGNLSLLRNRPGAKK